MLRRACPGQPALVRPGNMPLEGQLLALVALLAPTKTPRRNQLALPVPLGSISRLRVSRAVYRVRTAATLLLRGK